MIKIGKRVMWRKQNINLYIFGYPLIFLFSYIASNVSLAGDIAHYSAFYDAVKNASFNEAYAIAWEKLRSREPVSIFIIWVGAVIGIEQVFWYSTINILLLIGLTKMLQKFGVSTLVLLLTLTNFYVLVLLTDAIRLKISFVFLVFAVLTAGNTRFWLLLLATMSHFQTFLILPFFYFMPAIKFLFDFKKFRLDVYCIISVVFVSVSLAFFGWDVILAVYYKASAHLKPEFLIFDAVKVLIFFAVGLWILPNKLNVLLLAPLAFILTGYLSGNRLNMIFFCWLYFLALEERKLSHPAMLLLLIYFSGKSLLSFSYIMTNDSVMSVNK